MWYILTILVLALLFLKKLQGTLIRSNVIAGAVLIFGTLFWAILNGALVNYGVPGLLSSAAAPR